MLHACRPLLHPPMRPPHLPRHPAHLPPSSHRLVTALVLPSTR